MKVILATLASTLVLIGCGQANSSNDQYAGTWQAVGHPQVTVVISKQGSRYVASWVQWGKQMPRLALHLRFGVLMSGRATVPFSGGTEYDFALAHGPGIATLDFTGPSGVNWTLYRLSDSTASPTPSP